jgi:hypothetical protein
MFRHCVFNLAQNKEASNKAEDAGLRLSAMSENKRAWALQPTIVDDLRF